MMLSRQVITPFYIVSNSIIHRKSALYFLLAVQCDSCGADGDQVANFGTAKAGAGFKGHGLKVNAHDV
jgi:hypothetical protein